ncbi:Slx4p interacting protein [Exophiala sp. CCFEE 6388]|nr:Slx4p interacting protein [Eurotiomycetes sp. CCFEE 6388]
MDKLSNLHLLLRAPYFSKWPLEVRFFSQDVYRSWQTWCGRVDTHLPAAIEVHFDPAQTQSHEDQEEFTSAQPVLRMTKADLIGKGGVHGVDPTYARLRNVFEKSQFLLDEDDDQKCSKHPWTELMQQVTLRTRGLKEVQKLLKKKGKSTAVTAAEILESESEEEAEEKEALTAQDVIDEELGGEHEDEADLEDEEDDNASLASTASLFSPIAKGKAGTKQTDHQARLEIVIEDSEDER